ncbi:hypothetical protein [Micromonospora siamensis]|uniref:Nucleotidase n=1 Tax=Micromonospora siamensis TaxID=299152 RepID=A0A1C5I243_9ACTN|nr:hypothetical protein [Micromonospora siamensis]SCG52277.1 hypothetical protein GA0074704_2761 [Micromonospora siamensis]
MIDRMRLLGVDVGGVIIEPADSDEDTSFFGPNWRLTPPVPGAFEALATLTGLADEVHVVSKCGESTERRTRDWLAHHGFHDRTGIGPERLHFCRSRPEKGPIAARLGLTDFVDDRLEVLGYLDTVGHRYLFRPRPAEVVAHTAHLAGVHRVESWPELVAAFRAAG